MEIWKYIKEENGALTLDLVGVPFVTTSDTDEIKEIVSSGRKISAVNLNQDCYVAFLLAGITEIVENHAKLPELITTDENLIGEGANGKVYRINDEVIAKVFKKTPDFDDILRERQLTKNALKAGVPAPISFGYATVEGKLALMLEFVHATSLMKLIRKDTTNIQKYIALYVNLVKTLHAISGDNLKLFPRLRTNAEFQEKLARIDGVIEENYRVKLVEIVSRVSSEPEVLIHGDIQPSNVKVSDGTASFIDLETLSTGADIYDLAALYRTLFVRDEIANPNYNEFLKISIETAGELWDAFTSEYYKGKDPEYISERVQTATVLGLLMGVDKLIRLKDDGTHLGPALTKLRAAIDGKPFER